MESRVFIANLLSLRNLMWFFLFLIFLVGLLGVRLSYSSFYWWSFAFYILPSAFLTIKVIEWLGIEAYQVKQSFNNENDDPLGDEERKAELLACGGNAKLFRICASCSDTVACLNCEFCKNVSESRKVDGREVKKNKKGVSYSYLLICVSVFAFFVPALYGVLEFILAVVLSFFKSGYDIESLKELMLNFINTIRLWDAVFYVVCFWVVGALNKPANKYKLFFFETVSGIKNAETLGQLIYMKILILLVPFLVVCLIFSGAYSFVIAGNVESFSYKSGISIFDLVYFSFVTMTSLGYGDITPVSWEAKYLSMLQATFGMFFMAVVISVSVAFGFVVSNIVKKSK